MQFQLDFELCKLLMSLELLGISFYLEISLKQQETETLKQTV